MTAISAIDIVVPQDAAASGVAWPAIVAGALAATSLSLILLVLGSGLGLTIVSPWVATGAGAATFAISTVVWLVITQAVSSGAGGYLAGRLRTRWAGVNRDESYFRDTAHGFFAWALATLLVAGLLGAAVTSVVGGGAAATGSVVAGIAQGTSQGVSNARNSGTMPTDYFVDMFFRPGSSVAAVRPADANVGDAKGEVSRILLTSLASGRLSAPDKAQLTNLVSVNAGITEAEAQQRVDQVLLQIEEAKVTAKEAAESVRKAGVTLALMTFLSLLIGAFVASAAAALGGKHRENMS
jgi:hypothetical protein